EKCWLYRSTASVPTCGCSNTDLKRIKLATPPSSRFLRPGGDFDFPIRTPPLESPAQRELNQARRAGGVEDLPECRSHLNVGKRRVREIGMIPHIEEVRREPHFVPLGNFEGLDQRKIPVLLARPAIDVSPQVAEAGHAEIPIVLALGGVEQGSGSKCIQV